MRQIPGCEWLSGCCPVSPSPLRRDSAADLRRRAEPSRLAPSCTLAQPRSLLIPLVGSYPTVSALTSDLWAQTQRSSGGYTFCCGCSHTPVTRCTPPLAVSWGNRPALDQNPHTGRESGSSSGHRFLERNRPPATAVVRHFRLLSCDSHGRKPESFAPRTSINIPRSRSAVKLTTPIFNLKNRPQIRRIERIKTDLPRKIRQNPSHPSNPWPIFEADPHPTPAAGALPPRPGRRTSFLVSRWGRWL